MIELKTLLLLAATAPLALLFLSAALRSRRAKKSAAPLRLVGRSASVECPLSPEGFVLVDGELWRARARSGERVGRGRSNVRVVGASGCLLEVERAGPNP